jgi:phage protein
MKNILKRILLVILWFFFVMFIIGTITTNEASARAALAILGGIILLLILKIRSPKKQQLLSNNNELLLQQQLQKISILEAENSQLKNKLNEIGCNDYDAVQKVITLKQHEIDTLNSTIAENNATAERQLEKNQVVKEDSLKLEKKYASLQAKVTRLRYLFDAITQAINDYHDEKDIFALTNLINEADELSPSVILKLHNMDYKDLKKAFNENDKAISQVLEVYEKRYTTKANQSIYQLMVIALRAELQNILYNLKYDKLDKSIDDIKLISAKYLKIAGEGNQSISSTLTRFIGEIEYLFINAAKIEYNYYVKKEQAKQEQAAIREQIRQEAAERKALEAERKRIEQEEAKYTTEIDKLQTTILETTNNDEIEQLKARILELQSHLSAVVVKKEEIVNLQNGKAGNVYIISNLGSFGDNVFKIGMTRRLNPQERIDELGSASVPFKFDVHSFIFSQDAVALESSMHERLNNQRVNKVNLRKEFFNVSIDELERIVNELDPTAEFNKTMLAEEYRQSLSSDENYTSDNTEYGDDEEPFEVNDEIE